MSEKVAVLGPSGTFSEASAKKMFPEAELIYKTNVAEVFSFVEQGGGLGVVAVENNLEGSVGETHSCLLEAKVYIVGETYLDISLSLISSVKQKIQEVDEVLSHPHALAQCQKHLRGNLPQAVLAGVESTAQAVEKIRGKPGKAAIAMTQTAEEQNLTLLAKDIQDQPSKTRFLALGPKPSSGSKTSIIFALKDKPGALYEILKIFAEKNINLTKIESRPARTQLGDYIFFIDYENQEIPSKEILREIKPQTTFTKHLGSY